MGAPQTYDAKPATTPVPAEGNPIAHPAAAEPAATPPVAEPVEPAPAEETAAAE